MEPDELFDALERFEEIAFKHEDDLLDRFGKGKPLILNGVSFSSRNFKINYILDCGQHVCDSFPMSEWMEFYWNKKTMNKPKKYQGDSYYLQNMIEFESGEVVFIEDGGEEVYHNQTNGCVCKGDEFVGTGYILFKSNHNYFSPDWWYNLWSTTKDGKAGFVAIPSANKEPNEALKGGEREWEDFRLGLSKRKEFMFWEDFVKDFEKVLNQEVLGSSFSNFVVDNFEYEAKVRVSCLKNGMKTEGWITWLNSD